VDALDNLLLGFSIALTPTNLLWCFVGLVLGTVVGIIPGLTSTGTIAMLLPLAFNMDPVTGVIMMAGIYYGSNFAGSTTSILLNVPGEPNAVITCVDGYPLARQGHAGPALGITAIASFIAGTFSLVALVLVAPPISRFALRLGPPEFFALMSLGLALVAFLTGRSVIKGLMAAIFGVWLAGIGTDLFTGEPRFTFERVELLDGIPFIVVAIGIFAVGEVLVNMETKTGTELFKVPRKLRNLLPNLQDLKESRFAFLNGSLIGFLIGVLPGAGATIASFVSYGVEKAYSRHPEKFGNGAIEGVAAPEGATSSATGGSMVPLLTLGIPGSNTTAVIFSALIIWGLRPGPLMIQENPEFVWGLIASMYIGNVVLLILNIPLIPLFVQILRLPNYVLFPGILGLSIIGVYSVSNSLFHVWTMALFGLLGYAMKKLDFPTAPLVLGMVLGYRWELALRQSLMLSGGNIGILFTRPISAAILLTAAGLLCIPLIKWVRFWRLRTVKEKGGDQWS
jgi:putative tricarboxylic transport membrane protein